MLKSLRLFLLVGCAFCLFAVNTAVAASFPDVPEDHVNYEAIEYLDEAGVINGYEDGTFGPDNQVNRAEAMKMILVALGVSVEGSFEVGFDDVTEADWFFNYVMKAAELEIVGGYDDGEFKPGNAVNLAETLKMLLLTAGVEVVESVDYDLFSDVSSDAWFAPHVLYARDKNLITADDSGAIYPGQDMTRSAFAEVVYRLMIVQENEGEAFPLDQNWSYYESDVLPFKMKYDDASWEVIENENEVVFFKADNELLQFSPERTYPNSAVVRVQLDDNESGISSSDYFDTLEDVFVGAEFAEFNLADDAALEVLYSQDRTVDWYVYLADGSVLVVYTEYGSGILGYQLQQQIKSMLSTLEYQEVPEGEDYSELISEILENVLVEGEGLDMIDRLPDALIIETDTIGVGTGPVDYYYSEAVNYTFKYERSSDVILDTREGETTAF